MKKIILSLLLLASVMLSAQVKPGIVTLRESDFEALRGKRVGLITNPTGVDPKLNATPDILAAADGVELVAMFAPEHGIRGDVAAGARVATSTDQATGVKVYSIYGATKKPTPEMLQGIDALVYDIQDNGCRSYTFISTMGKAMEAVAEAGIEFIVLDRPNPLGGIRVEGPVTEPDCISFVSQYPIPYLYGLTPGELALYLKGEGLVKGADSLRLTIVPMEGWTRGMTYHDTGLPWVLPSPHIPSENTCLYYPATGIAGELGWISIGVGYTMPFRTFAAPWIDASALALRLNRLNLPGVAFRPVHYTPYYGIFKTQHVKGVEVFITDNDKAELTTVQFYVMQEIHKMYPRQSPLTATAANKNNIKMFDNVVGSKKIREKLIQNNYDVETILSIWNKDTQRFNETKQRYHLYE
ncbi:MAG: DUF1343 domain-containing protein [Muribaculaceae bacterium]|nr:DUF1343 domain-containing protein [Muribaculaceae bacterium]MDE6346079.1 DUF1343 domain-containing protein [Muribaculaceae bacterium]